MHKKQKKKRIRIFPFLLCFVVIAVIALYKPIYKLYLDIFYPVKYTEYVEYYSALNDIDHYFVYAIIKTEGGFDENAVSNVGARGLMQLMDETFEWVKYRMKDESDITYDDLFIPEYNIKYGTYLISMLLDEYGGDEQTALAAYHNGRGNVNRWLEDERYSDDGKTLKVIPSGATREYVEKVMNRYHGYKNLYNKGE